MTLQLQSDGSGSSSADMALNWDVTLCEIDFYVNQHDPDISCQLYDQTTYSEGG